MRFMKYQKGVNIFELAIILAAFASAGYVAKHIETDNPAIFAVAVASSFFVYFLPTLFYFIKDRRKSRKEKSKPIDPK